MFADAGKARLGMRKIACKKAQLLFRLPVFYLLLFLMLFTVGCSQSGQEDDELNPTQLPTITQAGELAATPTEKAIEFVLSEMKEIYFYTVNPDTFETEAVSAVVESGFADNPNELISLICDSLEDVGYEIGVKSAELVGDNVVVDFYSDSCPVTGLSEDEEKAVLDAIAQSLLDNLAEQNGVVFQVMGEAYESENFSFGQYYVYMKNQHK